jgi:hypothetical protein
LHFVGAVAVRSEFSLSGVDLSFSVFLVWFVFSPPDLRPVFRLSSGLHFLVRHLPLPNLKCLSGIRVDFSAQRLGSRSLDSFFLYQRPVVGIAWSSACSLLLVATKIFCVLLVSRAPVLDSPELWSHFLCSRISFLQIQLVFSLEVLPVSIFATQSAGA